MIEQIKAILLAFNWVEARELYLKIHPNKARIWERIEKRDRKQQATELLKTLLSDPAIHAKEREGKQAVEIAAVMAAPQEQEEEAEAETEEWEFPEHYPPLLQSMLQKASSMVEKKRRLSNMLQANVPRPQPQLVGQILNLSEQIDGIYQAKKTFDRDGYIPKEHLPNLQDLPNEVKELEKQVRLCRTRISKNKAKLRNPNESSRGRPEVWRDKIAEDEQLKSELEQKIYQIQLATR